MATKYKRPQSIVDLAVRLSDLGYWPVPIPRGCKGPTISGWQNLRLNFETVPDYFAEGMLVGILHKNVLALDIDVYDPDLSKLIVDEALRRFPGALERIGQAPKSALFFRMEEPGFKVHNTQKYEHNGYSAQVEVRSVSRQIVAYGKHPDTGKVYTWPRGELWETPICDLPTASQQEIELFRDWCEDQLRKWAGVSDKKVIDLGLYPKNFSDERPSEDQFKAALKFVPSNCSYDDWLHGLMAIFDFYDGSQSGLNTAQEWSSDFPSYNPKEVEIKWRSFEPGKGITYKTIFALAKQNGADLRELGQIDRPAPQGFQIATQPDTAPLGQATTQASTTWPTLFDDFDDASIEPRQWIYGTHYLRSFVSVMASAGGIGKTSLQIVEALAIVTGKPLLGEAVKEQCNVWIINLEDPLDEMKRRILAAMRHYQIKPEEVQGRLFVDAGRDFQLTFAAQTREGVIPNDALVDHLKLKIPERNIGCVFIDPFVGAHQINENDNMAVNAVVAQIRDVADHANCGINLVHHIRKGNGEDANIDSVRGAGSLIGAARAARVINRIAEKDALSLGIDPKDALGIFRVDDGKANLSPPAQNAVYRKMHGVQIANGEWIGVAIPFELPDEWSGMTEAVVNEMLAQIDRGMSADEEEFFSLRPQDKKRWVGQVITDYPFNKAEDFKTTGQAKAIIKSWIENGLLEEVEFYSAAQRKDRKGVISTGRVGEQK